MSGCRNYRSNLNGITILAFVDIVKVSHNQGSGLFTFKLQNSEDKMWHKLGDN